MTASPPAAPDSGSRLAVAIRRVFRKGYGIADFRADLAAGVVVGIVALPLSMALAIACGIPPQYGLYTAIVAGALIAALGGARTSVSGPTAAFVVILAPISAQYGVGGLLLATAMAGVAMIVMGWAKLGKFIEFVPHPVTTGFTSGIALVIATLQMESFLGLTMNEQPRHYIERVAAIVLAIPTTHWPDLIVGVATLAILLLWPKVTRRVPAALVALALVSVIAWAVHRARPEIEVATINSRFSYQTADGPQAGIPRALPIPNWPWSYPGPEGKPLEMSFDLVRNLAPAAMAIALLGAIESLLCAVVADGMTGSKHDPDCELMAQGIGNVAAPFFGGFAATAAIARTATAIRAGARSPIAPIVHAGFVLASVVVLAPLLGHMPMAALAALLLVVAWNMSDLKHFGHMVRVAPKSDVVVLVTCFLLTVVFDMVIAVATGVVLSSLLFMKRMSELSNVRATANHPRLLADLPHGVYLYEIAGPLFFGAAERAASAITASIGSATAVILEMSAVPTIDATGLVALESAIRKLQHSGALVILAGVQAHPRKTLAKAGLVRDPGRLAICGSLEEAETLARLVAPERTLAAA